jgi:NitT/TauT family transport system substrate-binding protein
MKFVLALCASLSALASSAGLVRADDTNAVRIGVTKDIAAASLYIATTKGYFGDEGVPAKLVFFESGAEMRKAADKGTIDFGVSRLNAAFFDWASKDHLKVIASEVSDEALYASDGLLMTKKSYREGLRDPKNFIGHRIGVLAGFQGDGAHYSLSRIAAKYKLDMSKLNLISFDTAEKGISSVSDGSIDIMILPYVTARQATLKSDDTVVARFGDYLERQAGVVFTRADLIADHRDVVDKFLRAYRHGVAEYNVSFQLHDDAEILAGPNYKEYLDVIAQNSGLPEIAVQNALPYCDHLARVDLTDFGRQLRFWQQEGRADKAITAAQLLDTTFFEHITLPETEY